MYNVRDLTIQMLKEKDEIVTLLRILVYNVNMKITNKYMYGRLFQLDGLPYFEQISLIP